jgi:hypothetical protein
MIQSKWIHRLVIIVLGLVIVWDGCLFLYVKTVAGRATQDSDLLYRSNETHRLTIPPDGFTSNDLKADVNTSGKPGWIVRYTALGCEYCQADEPMWRRLSSELRKLGYQVIVIVPTTRDEYPSDSKTLVGAQQESLVNVGWIKQFRLNVTPTLLIFDTNRGLIWSHQGMLGEHDVESAFHTAKLEK